jgi:CRISPR-associated protein Cas1
VKFAGRVQHPSPDPANAVLSLGYTLLCTLITGVIEGRGLEPCIGLFHELRPGRPSLALDLLEEFRHPIVDRFALRLFNRGVLKAEDFEPDDEREGGIRLSHEALKVFFNHWGALLARPVREADVEERLDVPRLVGRQVDRLAADFRGGKPYQPFVFGD